MSASFARLRGALDRVGTTTPGTIVGVFAEDLTAIMDHYVEVVREAAELKAAHAQTAQAVPLLSDGEIRQAILPFFEYAVQVEEAMLTTIDEYRAIEQAVRAKLGVAVPSDVVCDKDPQGCWNVRCQLGKVCKNAAAHGLVGKEGA